MSNHTPGPWKHGSLSEAGQIRAGGRVVARVEGVSRGGRGHLSNPETLTNARLIAAAPEMLAALRGAETRLATLLKGKGLKPENSTAFTDVVAAIAKAEGRPTWRCSKCEFPETSAELLHSPRCALRTKAEGRK